MDPESSKDLDPLPQDPLCVYEKKLKKTKNKKNKFKMGNCVMLDSSFQHRVKYELTYTDMRGKITKISCSSTGGQGC